MKTHQANMKRNATVHTLRCRVLPLMIATGFACAPVWANPTGAQVVAGQVTFNTSGNVLTITNSPGSIINWLNFSIGAGQTTQFLQQSSASAVLNRIVGQNPSQIFGSLTSNGKVYLINPNGILFGRDSQVDVGGLYASTLNISDDDFRSGKNNFTSQQTSPGTIVNQGSISTSTGGNIYMIAPQVQNSGLLRSPQGDIVLAAGHSVQLVDGADPNIQVVVSSGNDQALNLGQILAQGGKIGIYGALVNQSGTVNADSAVAGVNGVVVLKSSQSTSLGNGSVTSAIGTGADSTGGTVEVLGNQVALSGSALVDASGQVGGGKVLIGGDFHGANAAIPDANSVFVGANALIKADAMDSGNGGSVAVWSDQSTAFYGTISALGGALGGNGGYVETSSHNLLNFDGNVNLLAAKGSTGTLLLDPYTVTISDDTSNTPQVTASGSGPFTYASNATSYISTATLNTELAQSNVNINSTGSITVNSVTPVTWANSTLNISAGSDIYINSAINAATGSLLLNSSAGNISQNMTNGSINVATLSAVATTGNVSLLNPNNSVSALSGMAGGSGGFQFINGSTTPTYITYVGNTGGITTTAGDIQVQSQGDIDITAPLVSSANIALTSVQGQMFIQADMTAQNTLSLFANNMIDQVSSDIAPVMTAANLSAVSTTGNVSLSNPFNNISGSVAGSAGGSDPNGNGFLFVNNGSISVGQVAAVGANPSMSGISTQSGAVIVDALAGNLTMAAAINSAAGVTLLSSTGAIVQSGTTQISADGPLSLTASGDIGAAGAGNSLLTNATNISASGADIYISNSAGGALMLNQALSPSGAVNISTAGALTTPDTSCTGACPANITGSSITLVSGGSMTIGTYPISTAFSASSQGSIALYAGFTEAAGNAPQANGNTAATLTVNGLLATFNLDYWANSVTDFYNPQTTSPYVAGAITFHPDLASAAAVTSVLTTVNYTTLNPLTVSGGITGISINGDQSTSDSGGSSGQSGNGATTDNNSGIPGPGHLTPLYCN